MPRKLTIGKISRISIFQRNRASIVNWYDEHGARRNPSFATLKEAEGFQKQKRAELARKSHTPHASTRLLRARKLLNRRCTSV